MPQVPNTVDSRRQYVPLATAQAVAGVGVTPAILDFAEELIDQYVGNQDSFMQFVLVGRAESGSNATSFILQANKDQNAYQKDFFKNCEVEILGGTGAGQTAHISGSTLAGVISLYETLDTPLDSTSIYRIYQLGRFPRIPDVWLDGFHSPFQYYKAIPKKVQDAVIEQCKYILKMGLSYFTSDTYGMDNEVFDNYRYMRRNMAGDINLMVAPAAKLLLRGIMNRKGTFRDAGI